MALMTTDNGLALRRRKTAGPIPRLVRGGLSGCPMLAGTQPHPGVDESGLGIIPLIIAGVAAAVPIVTGLLAKKGDKRNAKKQVYYAAKDAEAAAAAKKAEAVATAKAAAEAEEADRIFWRNLKIGAGVAFGGIVLLTTAGVVIARSAASSTRSTTAKTPTTKG